MKKSGTYQWLRAGMLTGSALAASAATGQYALAQTSTAAAASAKPTSELDEIVVTGTTIAQKILETSFAVTAVDQETLQNSPSIGLAALLTSVPGLYGEASAGEINLNISSRGVRGGFLEYISLQEDGLPFLYNGFLEELELRRDMTYSGMQVTRGGPSGVLTSNGAAAIVNFISRKATDTPEGEVSVSYYNYGEVRTEAFYGTPIGNSGDTSATIGGYYRRGDGVKNVGYDANDGGQVRASITHNFEQGSFTVNYKHIDDHTQFYLPQPVKITQDGSVQRISPIPGFNASTDYLQGADTQIVNIKSPNGNGQTINLQDGIWERSDTATFQVAYDWQNGLRWRDSLRIAKINSIDNDLRNLGGNNQIYNATSFLATDPRVANLISTFAPQGAVSAALVRVGTGAVIANPATMNGNGLLTEMGANQFTQTSNEIINDSQLTFHTDKNDATLGLLSWNVNMDVSQIGVDFLLDVKNKANLIDVAAVNGAGKTVGHLTDKGVLAYDEGFANGTVSIKSNSLYFNDQFRPIDPLRIDAGVRYEKVKYKSTSEDTVSNPPLSGVPDPSVLADQTGAGYGSGTYTNGRTDLSGTAWTVGANYLLADNFSVYGRFSNAFDTGIANFGVFCPGSGCLPSALTRLRFGELGVRYSTQTFYAEVTGFRSTNTHISEVIDNNGGQIFLDNVATGAEIDAKWRPIDVFTLDFGGVVQHSKLTAVGGTTSFDGNQIDRLPNVMLHLTPTVSLANGRASAYATVSYYGKRWGDLANTLQLDAYADLAAGVSYKVTPKTTLSVQGTNLTDKFSITEGNPRGNSVIAGTNSYGFARANLPRVIKATVDVKF
jgi:outer membrane receptor protein involved in Fe transport